MSENLKGNFDEEGHWKWPEFYTYVRLAPNVDVKSLESKLDGFRKAQWQILEKGIFRNASITGAN